MDACCWSESEPVDGDYPGGKGNVIVDEPIDLMQQDPQKAVVIYPNEGFVGWVVVVIDVGPAVNTTTSAPSIQS